MTQLTKEELKGYDRGDAVEEAKLFGLRITQGGVYALEAFKTGNYYYSTCYKMPKLLALSGTLFAYMWGVILNSVPKEDDQNVLHMISASLPNSEPVLLLPSDGCVAAHMTRSNDSRLVNASIKENPSL